MCLASITLLNAIDSGSFESVTGIFSPECRWSLAEPKLQVQSEIV